MLLRIMNPLLSPACLSLFISLDKKDVVVTVVNCPDLASTSGVRRFVKREGDNNNYNYYYFRTIILGFRCCHSNTVSFNLAQSFISREALLGTIVVTYYGVI